ncbi:hypothetical protein O7635_03155 [Asanoa sp. WMMD1127]|uniref:hypothetical protein n=1 Tax=Asanoa sp. WMMD1127 TaxID=3016107 RepID=UPI002415E650|nr:hypothetical protein [Asanoa sp. WMMD1127]MDG4820850.1 hypothetical protein [Asanoa sp. WMMD1127]
MDINQILSTAREALSVRRVFGDPVERDGVTLVPAAIVVGGLGAGGGERDQQSGAGGGAGGFAVPAGAYSIAGGRVRWHPAVNANAIAVAAAAVAMTWLVTRSRGRRRWS